MRRSSWSALTPNGQRRAREARRLTYATMYPVKADPNIDLVVEGIKLATAILSLMAVLVGIAYSIATKLSKEERQKAALTAFRFATVALPLAGAIAYLIFDAERLGLTCYLLATVLTSIDYVRGSLPARRTETLLLVLSWVFTSSFFIMHELSRISNVLGRLIDLVGRLAH
jgi:hypothetical protein